MSTKLEPLVGARIKLERAKKHLEEFRSEFNRLRDKNPNMITADFDEQSRQHIIRFNLVEEIPQNWGAIIGDIIHNLRSALDYIAWQLVIKNGNVPDEGTTGFPIGDRANTFESFCGRKVKGASKKAIDLIKSLKPYKGGDIAFTILHKIDIVDKHRLLVLCVFDLSHSLISLTERSPNGSVIDIGVTAAGQTEPVFDLEHGAEIRRTPEALHMKLDHNEKFVFEVAFREPEIVKRQAVVPLLLELINLVERTIEIFDKQIFRNT